MENLEMKLTKSLLKTLIKEEVEKQDENFLKSLINKLKKTEPTREERQLELARADFNKALRTDVLDIEAYEPLTRERDEILHNIIKNMREGESVRDGSNPRRIKKAAIRFRSRIREWERETGNEGEQ